MALKTPPALVLALLLALALVLAACGGGSTAGPVAATTDATTSPATTATALPQPATPPATQTATRSAPAPVPTTTPQAIEGPAQPSGGASAPGAAEQDSSSASSPGSSAAASDEPTPAPAATTPTTEQPAAAAPNPEPAESLLDETAQLTLVNRVSPAHYFQQGTVTGTYDGTMEVEARITSKGVIVRFTATLPGGTISGRGIAVAILDSVTWPGLRGTAAVTGGTGRFAGIHGRRLRVIGRARPDASKARVRLAGPVSY
ncbi:MAG TPA: hypothetical protein VGO48_02205 [Conexibacter sp.]|nr:hypothetical protein [Conexibacter sp.]